MHLTRLAEGLRGQPEALERLLARSMALAGRVNGLETELRQLRHRLERLAADWRLEAWQARERLTASADQHDESLADLTERHVDELVARAWLDEPQDGDP